MILLKTAQIEARSMELHQNIRVSTGIKILDYGIQCFPTKEKEFILVVLTVRKMPEKPMIMPLKKHMENLLKQIFEVF